MIKAEWLLRKKRRFRKRQAKGRPKEVTSWGISNYLRSGGAVEIERALEPRRGWMPRPSLKMLARQQQII
jgi:hypothetical protein